MYVFGDQVVCVVDVGWVELYEFYVLYWQVGVYDQIVVVVGVGVG